MRCAAPLLALLLVGCATPARDRLVWISLGGSGPCTVDLAERRFTLPADEAALVAEARRLAATHGGALVAGAEGLSFPCYRATMPLIESAGFRRLGYVSDFVPD
jgi:hypothetical protein